MPPSQSTLLQPVDITNLEIGRQRLKKASLCSIYWCSNLRNAYWGSLSHLYSKSTSFHASRISAELRNQVNRTKGTRFQIEETPCLLLKLTGAAFCLIDTANQLRPFAKPSHKKISIKDSLAMTYLRELADVYRIQILRIPSNTSIDSLSLPLFKHSSYVYSKSLFYREELSTIDLSGIIYIFNKLSRAISAQKTDGEAFEFTPYKEVEKVCLP
jgi:hypothetical protein